MIRNDSSERITGTNSLLPVLLLIASFLFASGFALDVSAEGKAKNVLFIAVDDLRPELNCYGRTHIQSPNIDSLAASGMLFERAYCMVPTCGASRASLMTGIRPARGRFVSYRTYAEKDAPGITTLNLHFKNNGYHTVSNGKVFHHRDDCLPGWSETPWRSAAGNYRLEESRSIDAKRTKSSAARGRGPAYESADVPDAEYTDGQTAAKAVSAAVRDKGIAPPAK